MPSLLHNDLEPSDADLVTIEGEWPVISAEMEVVEAECRLAAAPNDVLGRRAHRRAVRRLLAITRGAGHVTAPAAGPDAALVLTSRLSPIPAVPAA